MESQPSLLDWTAPRYPERPGYKAEGTSREAADAIKGRAEKLRAAILDLLATADLTADECAILLKEPVWSIRPRTSELKARSQIYDTGARRKNESGAWANVLSTRKRPSPA